MVSFRLAEKKDASLILKFVKALASYEHLENEINASVELYEKWLFDEKRAEALFVLEEKREVGLAIFYTTFSTFEGKPTLYLEDIFICEEYRKKGYGRAVFSQLVKIAKERGYGRMDWACLNWNKKSRDFYEKMGARSHEEWIIYRLDEEGLNRFPGK